MPYEAELRFFRKLMENYNIKTYLFTSHEMPEVDLGLRRLLGLSGMSAERSPLMSLTPIPSFPRRTALAAVTAL